MSTAGETEQLIGAEELAKALGGVYTVEGVNRLARRKSIPAYKAVPGTRSPWIFKLSEVLNAIRSSQATQN